ncbi:hypothetical protein DKP78_17755, partial [Enterococcus faecium]
PANSGKKKFCMQCIIIKKRKKDTISTFIVIINILSNNFQPIDAGLQLNTKYARLIRDHTPPP